MGKAVITGSGGGGAGSDECTATKAEVLKGYKAITKDSYDELIDGTLELTGTAADSQVLSGHTYYNTDVKTKRTGAMANRGAVSQSLNAGGTYTIPAGYHSGSGKITQSLTTMGGQTISPSVSKQSIATSGKYMTGNVVVNPVNLPNASDLREGVNWYGRVGTLKDYSYLAKGQVAF